MTTPLRSVKVLFFAQAREQTKLKEGSLTLPSQDSFKAQDILNLIIESFPALQPLQECLILARNQNYLDLQSEETFSLESTDEIAVIPPISAGEQGTLYQKIWDVKGKMDSVSLTQDKINVDALVDAVSSPKCGAVSMFIGTTRDNFESKKVVRLEYEAYEPMAIAEMKKICVELRRKWNLENIGIVHRLGLVPVQEASIVVAISSEHRKESLEAVHYAIDALKASVPIWKKEVYEDAHNDSGININEVDENTAAAWKANKECFWKQPEKSLECETQNQNS